MLLCFSALTVISRRPPKNLLVNKFNKLLKWSPHFCEITTQINGASSLESRVQTQRPTCKPILGLRRLLKSLFVENLQPKPCLVKTKSSLLSTHIGISAQPLTTDRPYKDCWSDDHWGRINPPFSRSCWFLCESFRDWCWGDLVSVAETGGGWSSRGIVRIFPSFWIPTFCGLKVSTINIRSKSWALSARHASCWHPIQLITTRLPELREGFRASWKKWGLHLLGIQRSAASAHNGIALELETNLREVWKFTITEQRRPLLGPSPGFESTY